VQIGSGAPVVVQSMTNTDTRDVEATVAQIHALEELGCEVIRIAVPDNEAVEAIPLIKKRIHIPLIAVSCLHTKSRRSAHERSQTSP